MDKKVLAFLSDSDYKLLMMLLTPIELGNSEENFLNIVSTESNITIDELKSKLIDIALSFLLHGKAVETQTSVDNVDPNQLMRGIEVELEHTDNKLVAMRIALDHLAELPDYYTRLDIMEQQGKEAK